MATNLYTLRVLGTSVTLLDCIRQQAELDLGINIEYCVYDAKTAQRIAVTQPDSYDLYDQWIHNVDFVWPAQAIQPIEIERIDLWGEVNELAKLGRFCSGTALAPGGRPNERLYVQANGSLGSQPSHLISMLPLTHNADSFVYFADALPEQLQEQEESWGWLMDRSWSGYVALQSDAAIGALDAALALQANKKINFKDIGNLSLDEIDTLTSVMIEQCKRGHYAAFWSADKEAAALMNLKKVQIQSLWSPALTLLQKTGAKYQYARPKEGYRGWYGGIALSRCATDEKKEMAYRYLNWWMQGWAGAVMARQGLYISNAERSRYYMSKAEWNYWYEGLPATETLMGVDGLPLVQKGERRGGGAYHERMGHIGVWNSVMDEHNYLVRRWTEVQNAAERA